MEHLSSMKQKNVVLLYDLLLEMLDANTAHSRRISASPCSDPATQETALNMHADLEVKTPVSSWNTTTPPQLHSPITQQLAQATESQCSQE